MEALVSSLLVVSATLVAIPVIVFFLEILAATILPKRESSILPIHGDRGHTAVLVPAHNEGVGLLPTIRDIKAQLRSGDRLLVVADNCTDDTAAVATAAEAEVVERNDREKVGKGYALDWGIRYLGLNPPETVIIVDADCRLAEGAIDRKSVV